MSDLIRQDVIDRLQRLDEDAFLSFDDNRKFDMVIVGGSALILLNAINRATHDIDVIETQNDLYELMEKYDINSNAKAYEDHFPYNYLDRVVPIQIETRKINFYSASIEDIVIAKLCSVRDTDRIDIESASVLNAIDWQLLEKLATDENELRASILSERRYDEFLYRYNEYVERNQPCENLLFEDISLDM